MKLNLIRKHGISFSISLWVHSAASFLWNSSALFFRKFRYPKVHCVKIISSVLLPPRVWIICGRWKEFIFAILFASLVRISLKIRNFKFLMLSICSLFHDAKKSCFCSAVKSLESLMNYHFTSTFISMKRKRERGEMNILIYFMMSQLMLNYVNI